jgi:carboxylesterase
MKVILPNGEPFFFRGNNIGCLLIHGFTGTPKEMYLLGEHLADLGYTVFGPRLFGHATEPRDMIRARWHDWVASVMDGYAILQETCSQIFVIGLSMGGALALTLGAHMDVAGVVAMSTPHITPNPLVKWLRPFIPILSIVWRYTGKGPSDWHDHEAEKDHISYDLYPIRAVAELDDLLCEMRKGIPKVSAPVLLMYSKGDSTVTPEHGKAIYESLTVSDKNLLWVENSSHVITRDSERTTVFETVASFIRRLTD